MTIPATAVRKPLVSACSDVLRHLRACSMSLAGIRDTAPRDYWIERIRTLWKFGVETIIETGRLLVVAKEELPHGEFQAMIARFALR